MTDAPTPSAVVQAVVAAAAARDFDRVAESLDSNVVFYGTRGGLDQNRVIRGPEACVDYLREVAEAWEQFDVVVEQLIELGDSIVVFLGETGRSGRADLELRSETAITFKVRQQRIVEATGYLDREAALRAAGE